MAGVVDGRARLSPLGRLGHRRGRGSGSRFIGLQRVQRLIVGANLRQGRRGDEEAKKHEPHGGGAYQTALRLSPQANTLKSNGIWFFFSK
jgi:hypothetical protein